FGALSGGVQHAGKVLEEAGLLVAMIAALPALGAGAGLLTDRRGLTRSGLLAGAVAWLVVNLVFLPLAGDGLLGLRGGVTQALGWAIVFGVYAMLWETVWSSSPAPEPDLGRRRMLTALPVGLALGSLGVLGFLKVPG